MTNPPQTVSEHQQTQSFIARASRLISPARYLMIINILTTGLLAVNAFVGAGLLGSESYGIIGIISAINATVLNLLDIRLSDLASRLYYRTDIPEGVSQSVYRASVLRICIIGYGSVSLALCIVGVMVNLLTYHLFTTSTVYWQWIVADAFVVGMRNWMGSFWLTQRLSGHFYLMGTCKLVATVMMVVLFVPILLLMGGLDGYYLGMLLGTVANSLIVVGLSLFIWRRHQQFPLISHMFIAWPEYRQGWRFLFFGNLLGYSKLLHRASDVLLVAYFCTDYQTGLYKFARLVTDKLYIFYDALNQVYFPKMLEWLAYKQYHAYRALARRFLVWTAVATLGFLGLQALLMPTIVEVVFRNRFVGVTEPIMILTIPFFFVMGMHMWMWPVFVHSGKLGRFTMANYLACMVQYGFPIALFSILGASAAVISLGYLGYYVVLIGAALVLITRDYPEVVPTIILWSKESHT